MLEKSLPADIEFSKNNIHKPLQSTWKRLDNGYHPLSSTGLSNIHPMFDLSQIIIGLGPGPRRLV